MLTDARNNIDRRKVAEQKKAAKAALAGKVSARNHTTEGRAARSSSSQEILPS